MKEIKKKFEARWLVVIGTVLVQLGLGTIYTWSLFNQPLADKYGWQLSQVSTTFSITSFALAFATLIAGKLQEKLGIKKLAIIAGCILGGGLILTSMVNSLPVLYITAGLIVGAADGIAYITTLSNCIKWFPEKKGFISGISVGAFGSGSLIFKYINTSLLNSKGISVTFVCWGIVTMILIMIGAQFLKDAPIINNATDKSSEDVNYSVGQMIQTKEFYSLIFIFFSACMSGLYLIGIAKDIGVSMAGLTPQAAANAVAMVAIFNTVGRIILGTLSDKVGRLNVIIFTLSVTCVSVFVLSFVSLNPVIFFTCVASIAFCFGGNITVYPAIVGEFFGLKNQTKNYGVVYQGFGFGALSGSIIASLAGGFIPTFIVIGILCLVSLILMVALKVKAAKPRKFVPYRQETHKLVKEM